MLRALMRKAVADLRTRRLQTAILVVIIAMAAGTATMALSVQRAASGPFEELLAEANGAHLWVYDAAPGAVGALASHPGVEATSGPFRRTGGSYSQGDATHPVVFWETPSPLPEVSPALVLDGRWLSASASDEIVLDSGLADATGLDVGDRAMFATDGGPRELEVVGIAAPTSRLPYPIWDPAAVYVSPVTFQSLNPQSGFVSLLAVRLIDPEGAAAVMRDVNSGNDEPLIRGVTRWQEIQQSMRENARLKVIVLSTFSVFALLAVGLIVANVVSGQALAQRREIGLLKAVGFTPAGTTLLFTGQQLVLGAAGVAIGLVSGIVSTPYWLADIARQLGQPVQRPVAVVDIVIVVVGVLMLLLLFTVVPAWKAGRVSTIQALRGESDHPDRGASRTHALVSRLPLPQSAVTGLKDLFTQPVRTMLTISAMAMAAATIMFTLTVDATVDGLVAEPSRVGDGWYDLRVERLAGRFGDPNEAEPDTALSEADARSAVAVAGVAGVIEARQFGVRIGTTGYWARMIDGDLEALETRFTAGGWPRATREIVVGYGLAQRLGIAVGDSVTFAASEHEETARVSGIYVEGSNSGMMLMMRPELTREFFPGTSYAELWLVLNDGTDLSTVIASLRESVAGRMAIGDVRAAVKQDIESAGETLRSVLYPLNVVLIAIAVANLLTALLFTVRERFRDYALLKAIGFTPAQIIAAVSSAAVVIAVIGAALGAGVGYFVTSGLINYFGGEDGWPPGVATAPSPLWVLGLMGLAVAVAVVGSWAPARQAARTEVATVLRYE